MHLLRVHVVAASILPAAASLFSDADFLLWPYRNKTLNVSVADEYFPYAEVGKAPLDIALADSIDVIWNVAPGGLAFVSRSPEVLSALHSVAFMQPYKTGGSMDVVRCVKLAVLMESHAVFLRKGHLDDNDHMVLGDYGSEYGEYRWGVFMRFIQRMLRQGSPRADEYFADQELLMDMPIESATIEMTMAFKKNASSIQLRMPTKKLLQLSIDDFKQSLGRDLQFALALHQERIDAIDFLDKTVQVTIKDAVEPSDFRLHSKQGPWKNWSSYFGPVPPQPLAVIAQSAREKGLMVGDDLSDFYSGRITQAVEQGKVKVSVASPACDAFQTALKLHHLSCRSTSSASSSAPQRQSVLYSLAAKEKLSGELGLAAESSLKRIIGLPALAVLHLEGGRASLEIFEERALARVRGSGKKLAEKLHHGIDILHIHSCKLPAHAVAALSPGGLVLVEGLDCKSQAEFSSFLSTAQKLGVVAIGRRIAVVIKRGKYVPDERRIKWPHERNDL